MGYLTGFARRESGAALVEFAISLPFLLLVLFGMISWGHSITLLDNMYDAARKGARELAANEATEAQARATVQDRLTRWTTSNTFVIVAENTSSTGTDEVRVTVTSDNFFGFMTGIVPALPPLAATVTMKGEPTT